MKKNQHFVSVLLLCALLASLPACGGGAAADTTAADSIDDTDPVETEPVYTFDRDFGGAEFHILNAEDVYNMHAELDREVENGDPLDDAMFRRCRDLEEYLNIIIVEKTGHVDSELAQEQQRVIMSGEDIYDIMYVPKRDLYKFMQQNYLYNLLEFDEFNFDQKWWLSGYNEQNSVGNKLYAAMGYSQLMIVDSIWCLFFNENMMTDLNLEYPYDRVREGTWTLDAMDVYLKTAANLNGADSFSWDNDSVFGVAGGHEGTYLLGCGERTVEMQNGKLVLTAGTERYFNIIEKLEKLLTAVDGKSYVDYKSGIPDGTEGNYVTMFETQRSLFATMELCKTGRLRDKDWSYGIVPFPKYDEAQANYYTTPFYGTPGLAIPVTNTTPEDAAYISDALTYLSWRDVWPTYREITLEQKGLRNDDSIEMLDIIITSSVPMLTTVYGITGAPNASTIVRTANGTAASAFAAAKSKLEEQIAKING